MTNEKYTVEKQTAEHSCYHEYHELEEHIVETTWWHVVSDTTGTVEMYERKKDAVTRANIENARS